MRGTDWEILRGIRATELPVSVKDICRISRVTPISYRGGEKLIRENGLSGYTKNDAFSTMLDGRYIVFYDDTRSVEEKRVMILHEVAHIVNNHMQYENSVYDGKATVWNRVGEREPDEVELAATQYALKLLAPACVLWALKIVKPGDVEELCQIPHRCARLRAERMKELYDREKHFLAKEGHTCFLLSRDERDVYRNFTGFIEKEKERRKND